MHGNKSQAARQKALIALKNNKIQFLVATDVAARGIDVDLLSHVIIYDVPLEPESYVHRIGRTGRAGEKGHAMMMCEPGEIKYLKQVTKLIGKDIPMAKDNPFHLDFSKLSHREISEATKASRPGGGKGRGGHGGRSGGSKNKSHNRSSDR